MDLSILGEHPRAVADRVLAEESSNRRHIVVAVSGAHAYGFPSPDSDLDLKSSHIAPVESLLGLPKNLPTYDRLEVIDGVEIDYTSNEIGSVVAGLILGNGNYIERVLGELILVDSDERRELAELARGAFSKRAYRHYAGFARNQRHSFENGPPTAKRLLYVLRTTLTGVHLLRAGELRVELGPNAIEYGVDGVDELIAAKRAGEKIVLEERLAASWMERLDGLFAELKQARDQSKLPIEATNADELEGWLIALRKREL